MDPTTVQRILERVPIYEMDRRRSYVHCQSHFVLNCMPIETDSALNACGIGCTFTALVRRKLTSTIADIDLRSLHLFRTQVYYCFTTIDDEVNYIWPQPRWKLGKILFLTTRYSALIALANMLACAYFACLISRMRRRPFRCRQPSQPR